MGNCLLFLSNKCVNLPIKISEQKNYEHYIYSSHGSYHDSLHPSNDHYHGSKS